MRSLEIENKKLSLKLSEEQREVLVGILLGDAHLETQNSGKTYRLKIEQSMGHKDYVDHLHELFFEWVNTPPKKREVKSGASMSLNYRFSTLSHDSLRFYSHQFYAEGKKSVPKQIYKWLSPRALAYWYMDDGSRKSAESKGVLFNTQGFRKDEVERLSNIVSEKFDLQTSLRKQKEGYQIYVSGHSSKNFQLMIEPYIIQSMRYKLPHAE